MSASGGKEVIGISSDEDYQLVAKLKTPVLLQNNFARALT